MEEKNELDIILDTLPIIPEGFSNAMTAVNQLAPNAKVFFNPRWKRLEIFPLDGGWLGTAYHNLEDDLAPFSD